MVYDTCKIFVNNIGRKFKFKRYSIFIFSLEAGGNLKLKESDKMFSFMVTTLGWFL